MKNLKSNKYIYKPIGNYLIEADLISQDQIFKALQEQKITEERVGDILVRQGDIKRNTLDYVVEKIVEPERLKNNQQNLSNELTNGISDCSQIASDRLAKTLNLPTLELSPQKVCRLLLVIIACLIVVSSLAHFLNQSSSTGFSGRLFRLDKETNIPTLYSSLALAFCSILLAIIGYMKRAINYNYTGYWKALSLIFLYLAIDEMCSFHETFMILRSILKAGGLLYFTWVIPGSIFVAVFVLIFWRFIQSLPKKTKNLFIIAGTMYVGGAIGMEMIGGYHVEAYGRATPMYSLITTIEESLEMFGIAVFIYALLSYIASHLNVVNLRVNFHKVKKSHAN